MKATNQTSNDYAIASSLNELVKEIVLGIFVAGLVKVHTMLNIDEINRDYILLVNELEKIYDQNTELSAIKSKPIWRSFDRIKSSNQEIYDHIISHDTFEMQDHCASVERLFIITGSKAPEYSPEQRKLVDHAISAKKRFHDDIDKAIEKKRLSETPQVTGKYIDGYYLKYKPDGTILINDVLKLKKAHIDSAIDKLLEQALKNPDTPFKPNLGITSRNISTVISSAGFTPVLRDIFFPKISHDVVVFRRFVSRDQVDMEHIDTEELDGQLENLGAMFRLIREVIPEP